MISAVALSIFSHNLVPMFSMLLEVLSLDLLICSLCVVSILPDHLSSCLWILRASHGFFIITHIAAGIGVPFKVCRVKPMG
jgi:hypothetical protein